jgi:hypothetical protein
MHALQYAIAVLRMVALVVILFCVRTALIPKILAIIINAVYSYDGFIDAIFEGTLWFCSGRIQSPY